MAEAKNILTNHKDFDLFSLLPTPVTVIDKDYNIRFFNDALLDLLDTTLPEVKGKKCFDVLMTDKCRTENCPRDRAIEEGMTSKGEAICQGLGGMTIRYFGTPLKDDHDRNVGFVETIFDITEEKRLEEKVTQAAQEILKVANPIVPVFEEVIALPVIGTLDSQRAQQIMEDLLQAVVKTQSRVVIIDITGVPVVDTLVATHLLKTANAVRLLGASAIITGISPIIAQTLVTLGVDLSDVITQARMVDGVALALKIVDKHVVNLDRE